MLAPSATRFVMPSKRQRAQVDYAVFDPEQGPSAIFSDEDDFKPDADDDDVDMDIEMDDVASEHESPPPDEPEEFEEEPVPAKKPPKSKIRVKDSKRATRSTPKAPTPPPVVTAASAQTPAKRVALNESFGDRFRMIYGDDEKLLVEAIESRVQWGNVAFVPEQDIVERPRTFSKDFEPAEGSPSPARTGLVRVSSDFGVDGVPVVVNDKLVNAGETLAAQDVALLNAGGFCKDARWAPYRSGNLQYLAVTVLQGDPIDANAADISIGAFKPGTANSLVYFYEFDLESQALKPHALVDCGQRGPVTALRWRPCRESECAIVFQSGQMVILQLPERGSFTMDAPTFAPSAEISCVAWASDSLVLCGTKNGYVLQLDTSFEVLAFQQSHLSLISDISASYACSKGLETMCTSSTDGDTKVTDLNDLTKFSSIVRSKTFVASTCYLPSLNCYATQDDHILTRLVFARSPCYNGGTQLTRHEASVNALASSVYHPFFLSGSTDGSLCLVNALRRALVPKRNLKTEKDVVLWTLECEERTRKYRFQEKLAVGEYVAKLKAPEVLQLSPQTCAVTSIDWLQEKSAAGWYAAATASGLVRIEKLN